MRVHAPLGQLQPVLVAWMRTRTTMLLLVPLQARRSQLQLLTRTRLLLVGQGKPMGCNATQAHPTHGRGEGQFTHQWANLTPVRLAWVPQRRPCARQTGTASQPSWPVGHGEKPSWTVVQIGQELVQLHVRTPHARQL